MTDPGPFESLLAEARNLVAAATPGPWTHINQPGSSEYLASFWSGDKQLGCAERNADAAFIARSRMLVVELANELERLRAELADAKKQISWLAQQRESLLRDCDDDD